MQTLAKGGKARNKAHHLIWVGTHNMGYLALLHPSDLASGSRQPEYLAQHRLLAFLGKKICHFIHEDHNSIPIGSPNWDKM